MDANPTDPQSLAFRDAGPDDWTDDVDLARLARPAEGPVRSPEEWDALGWDADRQPPKTLAEAAELARDRGDDPSQYDAMRGL